MPFQVRSGPYWDQTCESASPCRSYCIGLKIGIGWWSQRFQASPRQDHFSEVWKPTAVNVKTSPESASCRRFQGARTEFPQEIGAVAVLKLRDLTRLTDWSRLD